MIAGALNEYAAVGNLVFPEKTTFSLPVPRENGQVHPNNPVGVGEGNPLPDRPADKGEGDSSTSQLESLTVYIDCSEVTDPVVRPEALCSGFADSLKQAGFGTVFSNQEPSVPDILLRLQKPRLKLNTPDGRNVTAFMTIRGYFQNPDNTFVLESQANGKSPINREKAIAASVSVSVDMLAKNLGSWTVAYLSRAEQPEPR